MDTPKLVLLCLLMATEPVTCQRHQGLGSLEPWMQGLIAVAVFLALVAIAFAVNHFWCQDDPEPVTSVMSVGGKSEGNLAGMDGRYSPMALSFRSTEHKNAYENENVMEEIPGVRSIPPCDLPNTSPPPSPLPSRTDSTISKGSLGAS